MPPGRDYTGGKLHSAPPAGQGQGWLNIPNRFLLERPRARSKPIQARSYRCHLVRTPAWVSGYDRWYQAGGEEYFSSESQISQRLGYLLRCKVLPLRLADLFALSDRVKAQAVLVDGKKACHTCGKRADRISRCTRCGLFYYCGEVSHSLLRI